MKIYSRVSLLSKTQFSKIAAYVLIFFGCLQFIGYVAKQKSVRGLGIAYCIAPLPTVFSTIQGVEGFDSEVKVFYDTGNLTDSILVSPATFNSFKGSYQLKNAYALFLCYPHILKPEMVESGIAYALCRGDLLRRLQVKKVFRNPRLEVIRKTEERYVSSKVAPKCQ